MKCFVKATAAALLTTVITAPLLVAVPAFAGPVPGQGTWEDTLKARDIDGNGTTDAFYDTTRNITWLANATENGLMNWSAATTWADNLVVGSNTGWRLPTMEDTGTAGCSYGYNGTDCGFNVATASSELAHLFQVTLGNQPIYSTSGVLDKSADFLFLKNTGNFDYMLPSAYWTGLQNSTASFESWIYSASIGYQFASNQENEFYALAVHSGDVTVAAAVPEPETYAMLLAGLGLLGAVVRRNKVKSAAV